MKLKHLNKVFRDINGYPNWIIKQTIEKVKNQNEMSQSTQVTAKTKENEHLLMLPNKGKVGETTLKSLRNTLKSVIPASNTCKIICTGRKLASKFNIKDKISKENKHDLFFLENLCKGKGIKFINNTNIDGSCLNRSKLHSNKGGTALLVKSFSQALKPN